MKKVFTLTALPACLYREPSATPAFLPLIAKFAGKPFSIKASSGVNFRIGSRANSSLDIVLTGLMAPYDSMKS